MMIRQLLLVVLAIVSLPLMALELSLDVCSFKNNEATNPYIEAYMRVLGATVKYNKVSGGNMQAAVNVTITIEQGEKIIAFDKFVLNSPVVAEAKDLLDLRRFAVPPATYAVHIVAIDAADSTNMVELKQYIEVPDYSSTSVSDILLLAKVENRADGGSLVKHGIYMEPVTFSYLEEQVTELPFFAEVYGAADGAFLKYTITEGYLEGGTEVVTKYKKLGNEPVSPLLLSLPLSEVRSGKYSLTVEIYDRDKQLVSSSSTRFLRSNPSYDTQYWTDYNKEVDGSFVDSIATKDLRYHLLSLLPVAQEPTLTNLTIVLDLENVRAQRKFLFDYWKEQSPKYPHIAHAKYMKVVDLVHDLYDNNVGFGFQTDRGHIFLKYGKPSEVVSVDNEPDAVPYEIWYYHTLSGVTRQTNTRFLFYNPSLSHNDYQLLHSTCIGERNNPAWEVELYRDAPESQIGSTIEATDVQRGWNRRAREYFNDY